MILTGLKINFLGDSITQGCCATSSELGFVEIIKRNYGLLEARNYGIGGTRIARHTIPSNDPQYDLDFCMRFSEMESDADVVIVFGGTNDHGHGDAPLGTEADRTPDTFWGACHCLWSSLRQAFPAARIIVLTPLHRIGESDPKPGSGAVLSDYVNILRSTAGEYGFPVLDLFETSALRAHIPQIAEELTTDGLHPNDAGHRLLAEEIAAFLQKL